MYSCKQQVKHRTRIEGTRSPAHKLCWRLQQHAPALGHPPRSCTPARSPSGAGGTGWASCACCMQHPSPIPLHTPASLHSGFRLQSPLRFSDPSFSYSPLAKVKTSFPVKSSPPLAIQFILVADSYSGPNMINTFIFIFHTYSINKANTKHSAK